MNFFRCDAEFENILNDIEYADVLQISDICDEPMNDTTLKGTTDDNSQSNLNDESTIKIEGKPHFVHSLILLFDNYSLV